MTIEYIVGGTLFTLAAVFILWKIFGPGNRISEEEREAAKKRREESEEKAKELRNALESDTNPDTGEPLTDSERERLIQAVRLATGQY